MGVETVDENALLLLLVQIAAEPCFNILRTKEQLGYLVHCNTRLANGVQGLRFIIQSDKDVIHLDERIEAFLVEIEVGGGDHCCQAMLCEVLVPTAAPLAYHRR